MAVSDEQALQLFHKFIEVCVEIAKDAHSFIGTHNLNVSIFNTNKYPRLFNEFLYDNEYLKDKNIDRIPYLKYKIPKYEMVRYPSEKMCYSLIFENYGKEHIDLKNYDKIEKIRQWIDSEPELVKVFSKNDKISSYLIKGIVNDVVERYLYTTNATEAVPSDIEEIMRSYVSESLLFYLEEELFFDICVPICLITFQNDEIKLDDNIEIIRISEDIQKSRQVFCRYEVNKEDWVAACATHMLILHNYCYKKSGNYTFDSMMKDYSCYPLDKIDEILGLIRIITGCPLGYEQMFCLPKGWVYETKDDLVPLYGAKTHFVNSKYLKMDWSNLPVSYVSDDQCEEMISLYEAYQDNVQKLKFPLLRYNRCVLRDEVDDMTTDACIGLEALLSGQSHMEITYSIASRIPLIFANTENHEYLVTNGRMYMKKIYNLRSKIVHGGEVREKDMYIDSGDDKIHIPTMAVDFLRLTLLFMIKNPKYLNVNEIDSYVDLLVSNTCGI